MKYFVVFKLSVVKDLKMLPVNVQKIIGKKLEIFLSQNEPLDYAVPLVGGGKVGDYRYRIGDYRVVFDFDTTTITVLLIEHRRDVYRQK